MVDIQLCVHLSKPRKLYTTNTKLHCMKTLKWKLKTRGSERLRISPKVTQLGHGGGSTWTQSSHGSKAHAYTTHPHCLWIPYHGGIDYHWHWFRYVLQYFAPKWFTDWYPVSSPAYILSWLQRKKERKKRKNILYIESTYPQMWKSYSCVVLHIPDLPTFVRLGGIYMYIIYMRTYFGYSK